MKVKKLAPEEINFIVRLPNGDEYEVSASEQALAKELFEAVTEQKLIIVELESGESISYQMINKQMSKVINMEESLAYNFICEGSIIIITRHMVAG